MSTPAARLAAAPPSDATIDASTNTRSIAPGTAASSQSHTDSPLKPPSSITSPPGWVDIHGHFYPPASDTERKQKWQAMRDGLFLVPESATIWDPSKILTYLDKAGVQMQMLSNIPRTFRELQASNNYGAEMVKQYPTRFGLLAAIPTDDVSNALNEIDRAEGALHCDGFAVTCCYNGVYLGDRKCDPIWEEMNRRKAVVHCHPNAYAPGNLGRPSPLIEVAFETCRTVVHMLYEGVFKRYPDITWIFAHTGGALPALSGRIKLLGAESWVPNPEKLTKEEIKETLARLYLDTAATAMEESLGPAVKMVGKKHLIYGSDCGVPCSTDSTMEENRKCLIEDGVVQGDEVQGIGTRGWELFTKARDRVMKEGDFVQPTGA